MSGSERYGTACGVDGGMITCRRTVRSAGARLGAHDAGPHRCAKMTPPTSSRR